MREKEGERGGGMGSNHSTQITREALGMRVPGWAVKRWSWQVRFTSQTRSIHMLLPRRVIKSHNENFNAKMLSHNYQGICFLPTNNSCIFLSLERAGYPRRHCGPSHERLCARNRVMTTSLEIWVLIQKLDVTGAGWLPRVGWGQTPDLTITACRDAIKGWNRDPCLQGSSGKGTDAAPSLCASAESRWPSCTLPISAPVPSTKLCVPYDQELFTLKPHSTHVTHTEKLAIDSEQWPNVGSVRLSGNPDKYVHFSMK